jgi:hypothetical protein
MQQGQIRTKSDSSHNRYNYIPSGRGLYVLFAEYQKYNTVSEQRNKYSKASGRGMGLIVAGIQQLPSGRGNLPMQGAAPPFAYHCHID